MKKIFTLIMTVACSALTAWATDYTCPLTVVLNGSDIPCGDTKISVTEENGSTTLSLMNFSMMSIVVGDIVLTDVVTTPCGVVTSLYAQKKITITSSEAGAIGPGLGEVPILMNAEIREDKMNAILAINMGGDLGVIGVRLGGKVDDLGQIANGSFDNWHTATLGSTSGNEPNAWHSFISCSGSLASTVAPKTRLEKVTETIDGSSNTYAKVSSNSVNILVVKISANGTITTGRLAAESMTAADNYSYLNMSESDFDGNGDPFYTVMTNKPDALKLKVNFKVGKRASDNNNVNALASAYITDGKEFHDPDTKYTNYVANINHKIPSTNDAWQELTLPFSYKSDAKVSPKALLVTLSTCSVPAGGSTDANNPDVLCVDDVSLVYYAELSSLKFKNQELTVDDKGVAAVSLNDGETFSVSDIVATANGVGAYVSVSPLSYDEGKGETTADITIISNDLKTYNIYTLKVTGGKPITTGVEKPAISGSKQVTGIYNLNGQRVNEQVKGQVYITKYADGSTVKTIGK